eukprot:Rmarinus@m.29348
MPFHACLLAPTITITITITTSAVKTAVAIIQIQTIFKLAVRISTANAHVPARVIQVLMSMVVVFAAETPEDPTQMYLECRDTVRIFILAKISTNFGRSSKKSDINGKDSKRRLHSFAARWHLKFNCFVRNDCL